MADHQLSRDGHRTDDEAPAGDLFKIDICVAMPNHKDILVSKAHGDAPEHEHVMVAIKDAFAAAQRQIEDAARESGLCALGVLA